MVYPNHIVAAVTLITDRSERILMIESPNRSWGCPGGKIEEGENIIAGLKREVFEETGTQVDGYKLIGVSSNISSNVVIFSFLSRYVSGRLTPSAESVKVEWFKRNECLEKVSHPSIRDRMKDMLNFDGKMIYRAYEINPYRILEEHYV